MSYFLTYHQGERTGIYYVDATKLPVCHNLRKKNHKVFEGLAGKSKTSTGWFLGLKLHLVVNNLCELVSIRVTRGNTDDRTPLLDMCRELQGMIFGDCGYVSKAKAKCLAELRLKLITTLKKNMKKLFRTPQEKQLLRHRGMIETLFDYEVAQVCNTYQKAYDEKENDMLQVVSCDEKTGIQALASSHSNESGSL